MSTPNPRAPDTKFHSPAASIRSLSALLEDDGRTPVATALTGRPISRPGTGGLRGVGGGQQNHHQHPHGQLQALLSSKDSEAALLRQQLAQLTADFKFNLKLLEERDAELERAEGLLARSREEAAAREAALSQAKRAVSEREAALKEKQARVSSLEARQLQLVELCERQIEEAQAKVDREASRCRQEVASARGEAARAVADATAGYERQLTEATAAEREARSKAAALADENAHVRAKLQRAEARLAEQELAMQRMVSQFEGALGTLRQLEQQYDALAGDAAQADELRSARIHELEGEASELRTALGAAQRDRQGEVARLSSALQAAEAAAAEAKQQYHRAMMDAAELAGALAEARREAGEQRSRAERAEAAAAEAQEAAQAVQATAQREGAAAVRAEGLAQAARLAQEAARRELEDAREAAAQLREAVAVLEAERDECAAAAEAAQAKAASSEERACLLAQQLEQERGLQEQLLAGREAEVEARWRRALDAAQAERSAFQQALDLANRQLQGAHGDTEELRGQLQQLRLAAGTTVPGPAAGQRPTNMAASSAPSPPGPAGMGGQEANRFDAAASAALDGVVEGQGLAGSAAESLELGGSEAASPGWGGLLPGASTNPSSQLQPPPQHSERPQQAAEPQPYMQLQQAAPRGASAYQGQLHRHMDALAGRLSSFQRAVKEARAVGQRASQQLAESSAMLPPELAARQEAVAGAALQQTLAAERQQHEQERRRLDAQLAEQQAALAEKEAALQRLQAGEEERWRRREEEARLQERQQQQEAQQQQFLSRQQQHQQQQQQHQWQPWLDEAQAPAGRGFGANLPPRAGHTLGSQQPESLLGVAQQLQPGFRASAAGYNSLVQGGSASQPGWLSDGIAPLAGQQRRSVSAALAAATAGSSPAIPSFALSGQGVRDSTAYSRPGTAHLQAPPGGLSGGGDLAGGAGHAARSRPASGSFLDAMPPPAAAAAASAGDEDPLTRARRQVLAAKQYLRSVAELGQASALGGRGGVKP